MENSQAQDYVSEKVYDALAAGCVPIYWGAANVNEYVPHASALINYAELGSPAALQTELERLATNLTAYEEKLAWKGWPSSRWSSGELVHSKNTCLLPSHATSSYDDLQTAGF
jgi:hypothetical protein